MAVLRGVDIILGLELFEALGLSSVAMCQVLSVALDHHATLLHLLEISWLSLVLAVDAPVN